ncbi:ABC transporter permease [Telmatospirillum siberiense]|uniref:ABC transporter permease n=1 Tax=Telmatospirillum siberiense TaxID=382514 RepID=A0A2N3PVM3_9PROT|nr:ABC transporter permease [Telmatospirillum siberiense]PKU24440.1 ABC transporter permease [Telmatospirillum siberiense]
MTAFLKARMPVLAVGISILLLWYGGAIWLNAPQAIEGFARAGRAWGAMDLVHQTFAMKRPVLPTPDQVLSDLIDSLFHYPPTSIRNLLYHAGVTAEATLLGFLMGVAFGALLAVGIVHLKTLDSSLMPWVIISQTIPILAIAPMVVVIFGNLGFTGLLPKAVISMYLCFFPITIGLVKGLRSTDPLALDLMRTYSASVSQTFWLLRLPTSLPYLFTSIKVSIAISLIGAIVAELPTGGTAGLGARLLSGSYYGQTVQIWSALVMSALLSLTLVGLAGLAERLIVGRGGRKGA